MANFTYQPSASQISHEICILLAGIMGILDSLKDSLLTGQNKKYFSFIKDSVEQLPL